VHGEGCGLAEVGLESVTRPKAPSQQVHAIIIIIKPHC